jgi:hypothetical protein
MALKKQGQVMRRIKTNATPVPMPRRTVPRAPGSATPVPMPTREPNYGKGRPVMPPGKQLGPKKPKRMPSITTTKPKRESSGPLKPKRAPARRKMI